MLRGSVAADVDVSSEKPTPRRESRVPAGVQSVHDVASTFMPFDKTGNFSFPKANRCSLSGPLTLH